MIKNWSLFSELFFSAEAFLIFFGFHTPQGKEWIRVKARTFFNAMKKLIFNKRCEILNSHSKALTVIIHFSLLPCELNVFWAKLNFCTKKLGKWPVYFQWSHLFRDLRIFLQAGRLEKGAKYSKLVVPNIRPFFCFVASFFILEVVKF